MQEARLSTSLICTFFEKNCALQNPPFQKIAQAAVQAPSNGVKKTLPRTRIFAASKGLLAGNTQGGFRPEIGFHIPSGKPPHAKGCESPSKRVESRDMKPFSYGTFFSLAFFLILQVAEAGTVAHGSHGAIASIHPLATQAGLGVLKNGGNAIDAAVAAAVTLGVVDGHNSGLGGGCFMLIRRANGEIVAIDGREMAPAAATRDMFLRDGKADTRLSQTGPLAAGIPGSVAVYAYAAEKFGRKKLGELLLPAAKIAEDGFPIDAAYAARLKATATELREFTPAGSPFFHEDGSPLREGEILR
jgi:hypothetical protein